MKGFILISLGLSLVLGSCSNTGKGSGSTTEALKNLKAKTDQQISDKSLIVIVKVEGKKDLMKVENKHYPQNIETTYNLLKDEKGRVVYIAEMPFSKTSEWFIAYKSYFDSTGNLYAFQRLNNFLNNGCTRGAAMENLTRYYDTKFNIVDSVYTLTDTYKKPLDKTACKFPYNFPYKVIKTWNEYKGSKGLTTIL